ncbi:MAG: hypothetical protein U5Q03_18060 [Bacteroidota bacterium]|nr:hypothetical protein [Bacteroidota bacterium]
MKKELVKEAGFLEQSKYSFFADRLIACMPEQIILDELSVFPASQDKRSKKLSFVQGVISVKGELQDPSILNNWINNLQKKDWISEVQVVKFDHNTRRNTSYFEIEISLS